MPRIPRIIPSPVATNCLIAMMGDMMIWATFKVRFCMLYVTVCARKRKPLSQRIPWGTYLVKKHSITKIGTRPIKISVASRIIDKSRHNDRSIKLIPLLYQLNAIVNDLNVVMAGFHPLDHFGEQSVCIIRAIRDADYAQRSGLPQVIVIYFGDGYVKCFSQSRR